MSDIAGSCVYSNGFGWAGVGRGDGQKQTTTANKFNVQ